MAHQFTETSPAGIGKNLCTVFIESVADLSNITGDIRAMMAIGSVAYTPAFVIYTLTTNGWVDSGGTVVSA